MNELFSSLGIESWKAVLGTLLVPPAPLLLLILAGAIALRRRRRALGWSLLWAGMLGIWLSCTTLLGGSLSRVLLDPPPPLGPADIDALKGAPNTAIVVLGAGRYLLAPEYGLSNLRPLTMERLRYGVWLARATGLPLAYSGGVGWGGAPGPSEAEIAARIAANEFRLPLRWTEGESRDTNENAFRTIELLQPQGIRRIVIVTHGFHMRRALGDFERAVHQTGTSIELVTAPMGLIARGPIELGDWLPTRQGYELTSIALHEWIGRLAGA